MKGSFFLGAILAVLAFGQLGGSMRLSSEVLARPKRDSLLELEEMDNEISIIGTPLVPSQVVRPKRYSETKIRPMFTDWTMAEMPRSNTRPKRNTNTSLKRNTNVKPNRTTITRSKRSTFKRNKRSTNTRLQRSTDTRPMWHTVEADRDDVNDNMHMTQRTPPKIHNPLEEHKGRSEKTRYLQSKRDDALRTLFSSLLSRELQRPYQTELFTKTDKDSNGQTRRSRIPTTLLQTLCARTQPRSETLTLLCSGVDSPGTVKKVWGNPALPPYIV